MKDSYWLKGEARKAADANERAIKANDKRRRSLQESIRAKTDYLRLKFLKDYGVTSFIIALKDVPGGTVYDEGDSRHMGTEIGFERTLGVDARHIAAVYPVRWNGYFGKPVEVMLPVSLRGAADILHKKAPKWAK